MKFVDGEWIRLWILLAADELHARRAELNALDGEISDGDHGDNLVRGFGAAVLAIDSIYGDTPREILGTVGITFLSAVSGSSGPMLASTFFRMAEAAPIIGGKRGELDPVSLAALICAGARGVVRRGRSDVGSKTMADAWIPAARAAEKAAQADGDCLAVLRAAADAAARGARGTAELQANKGRAQFRGERSRGYVDAGAQSSAYILECAYRAAVQLCQNAAEERLGAEGEEAQERTGK